MIAVVSNAAYPSLQSIMDLFRALTNTRDTAANSDSMVLPFLNSAIQDTFSDLRTVGSPRLIREAVMGGFPLRAPVNSTSAQQFLAFTGFFDGVQFHPSIHLPADLLEPSEVWERQSGTNYGFAALAQRDMLSGYAQSYGLGGWEWRDDRLYFSGSTTTQMDIRLRYVAIYPDMLGTALDFTTTFVPIRTGLNAITYKMVAKYAFRLAPETFPMAKQESEEHTTKLQQETVLQQQGKHHRR